MEEVIQYCKKQIKEIYGDYDYSDRTYGDVADAYKDIIQFIKK